MQIDISIIVPFYYGNKYIQKIIEIIEVNVQNSSIKTELIIVNDSPDETVRYDDSNISYNINVINNEYNVGIHHSRVNGIIASRGNYVLMLDQDDMISSNCLQSQKQAIKNYDMVISNGFDESQNRKIYKSVKQQELALNEEYYYYIGCMIVSPGQCLIKKRSIPLVWMKYYIQSNGSDDLLLWLLMFNHNCSITINNEDCYRHINTGVNLSSDFNVLNKSCLEVLDYLNKYDTLNVRYSKVLKKRLRMRSSYEGKGKASKILAYIKYFSITMRLINKKFK